MLRPRVMSKGWEALYSGNGGDLEQTTTSRLIHITKYTQGLFRYIHGAPEIRFEHPASDVLRCILDFGHKAMACVAEDDVYMTEVLDRSCKCIGDILWRRDIKLENEELVTTVPGRDISQALRLSEGGDSFVTFLQDELGHVATKARRRSRHWTRTPAC